MSIAGGAVHHHLRMYKDSSDAQTRERLTIRLAALLSLFMEKHAACVGEWDVVTSVPSAQRIALAPILAKLKRFDQREVQALAAAAGNHGRTLDADHFDVVQDVGGKRVLLVDDTFTTGAKLFSAVAALRRSGATIIGPVVLGRHVQTSWGPSEEMMTWLGQREWREDRCCRCGGERRDEGALF